MVDVARENSVSDAKEKIKEGVQEFAGAVSDSARETAQNYADQTTEMIRENPYRSVLIAFGVGALIGAFFFRGK